MGWIYVYEDNGFAPDNISHLGYVFSRSKPIDVDEETAAKLRPHPHFVETASIGKPSLAVPAPVADVPAEIDKSGLLEASGIMTPDEIKKAKKASYMRDYFARKKASK